MFLLRVDDPQSEPYVSKTANLRRRLQRLLGAPAEHSKKLNLRDRVRWIEYSPTGSDFESGFLLYRLLRSTFPKTYSHRLRLRFAPLVKLHLENEFPVLHHYPTRPSQRTQYLLRAVSLAHRGREVCQRLARLFQDAPLCR